MNSKMSITSTEDGQFQVVDASGHLVAGPFASNAEAWSTLDKLTGDDGQPKRVPLAKLPRLTRAQRGKGKANGKTAQRNRQAARDAQLRDPNTRLTKKERRRMEKNAAKAPTWIRDIVTSKYDPNANRSYRNTKLGPMGAASPVRKIDPAEYLAEQARKKGGKAE